MVVVCASLKSSQRGTPEAIVACKASHTGRFLKRHLRPHQDEPGLRSCAPPPFRTNGSGTTSLRRIPTE